MMGDARDTATNDDAQMKFNERMRRLRGYLFDKNPLLFVVCTTLDTRELLSFLSALFRVTGSGWGTVSSLPS